MNRLFFLGFLLTVIASIFWGAMGTAVQHLFLVKSGFSALGLVTLRQLSAGLLFVAIGTLVMPRKMWSVFSDRKLLFDAMEKLDSRERKIITQRFGLDGQSERTQKEVADSLVFIPIAFLGQMPIESLVQMLIAQVVLKTAYEVIILPITTIVVNKVDKYERGA